ncbi:MAG TPA: RNA-binding domain-containing protein [Blastocatellia bacterium]
MAVHLQALGLQGQNEAVYTSEELEHMLLDLESDSVERKESLAGDAPTKIREAICAFANDLPGRSRAGVVFVGVRDDGSPSGLAITDELLRQLADMKTDANITPPPIMTVEKQALRGSETAIVTVEPSDSPPVRYRGRVYIRIGPRRAIASSQDERILNEKRRHRDRPFDVHPVPSANLGDLDRRFFEEVYLPSSYAPDILAANDRTSEQRLAACKMIVGADEVTPTVLGVLILSRRTRDFLAGAYVQFLRIAGTSPGDAIVDEQVIDGTIVEVLRRIDEKLLAHNRTSVEFTNGPVEQRKQPYPMPALQQLVRNAIMHRTYEATNNPIRVYWYDDRIEIINPGGPYGIVNAENFGRPGITDYRNPNLAEALHVLGFVQRYGFGIPTAQRALADNGNPPVDFDVQQSLVSASVRPA